MNISKRRPKSINISGSSILDLSVHSPDLNIGKQRQSDGDLKSAIANFKECAERLIKEFALSVKEIHSLIEEVDKSNAFDSETFILKNENIAL